MSLITPASIQLLGVYQRSKRAHEATGASLYGPDLSEWPVWAVDLMETLEIERIRVNNAEFEHNHGGAYRPEEED